MMIKELKFIEAFINLNMDVIMPFSHISCNILLVIHDFFYHNREQQLIDHDCNRIINMFVTN